jgi:hypothetical protein
MKLIDRLGWPVSGLLIAAASLIDTTTLWAQAPETAPAKAKVELNDKNYADWKKHILPDTGELAWQQIPWATTFKDGIVAADAAGKPLLFWTMNGHPLGCT